MAGIYIHIPYCKKACSYCNFHFSTNLSTKAELVNALIHQICHDDFVKERDIQTIYFGGGTPSILSKSELTQIIDAIHTRFDVHEDAEITLESNPDDVTPQNISIWQEVGINRISLGVQSFFDEDLAFMNRVHTSHQSLTSIHLLQKSGFSNITIDLIYGSPTTTDIMWKENLKRSIDLGIPHISAYGLTVEDQTSLAHQIKKGRVHIDDHKASDQFEILIHTLLNAGFEHYEISNFSKPGFYSKHNTSYWQNKTYHGFGPGAHAYNGTARKWMIANNAKYIEGINNDKICYEVEILSKNDHYNEYIMTRLRTQWGVIYDEVINNFGNEYLLHLRESIYNIDPQFFISDQNSLVLSHKGKFYADRIASQLFIL